MHGRNLTSGFANVLNTDIIFRNNRHHNEAFLYGFKQFSSLYADIFMKFNANIEMAFLMWLRTQPLHHELLMSNVYLHLVKNLRADIHNELAMNEMELSLEKITRADIHNAFDMNIQLFLDKSIRGLDIFNSFNIDLSVDAVKPIRASEFRHIISVGSNLAGTLIADYENLTVDDVDKLTVDSFIDGVESAEGLLLSLGKEARTDIHNELWLNAQLGLRKYTRGYSIPSVIDTPISLDVAKHVRTTELNSPFIIGSGFRGARIVDIQDLTIEQVSDMTVDELVMFETEREIGLRLGLVKALFISDIQDLTIAEVQNRTVEEISLIRIA